jgi:recombinational DNA repair protein RecT
MVCLDIMYRGLIKIATDAGSIRWVQAEVVYSSDKFSFRGPTVAPEHNANPFAKDRGAIIGVYCVAKTVDGDLLTDCMSVDEVNEIRDRSSYYKKTKKGPWATDYGEMAKKTVIKRARKTWPESSNGTAGRLQHATELANIADGYDSLPEQHGAITPSGGAWESMSEESQEFLQGIANKVIGYLSADQLDDACAWIDTQKLDADEQVALNTRFNSTQRSAMKKWRDSQKAKA